jgi:hypothetical protein
MTTVYLYTKKGVYLGQNVIPTRKDKAGKIILGDNMTLEPCPNALLFTFDEKAGKWVEKSPATKGVFGKGGPSLAGPVSQPGDLAGPVVDATPDTPSEGTENTEASTLEMKVEAPKRRAKRAPKKANRP